MPVDRYVVDFCCEAQKLIVEIDGGHHDDRHEADAARTAALEAHGYLVLRFWNNDVLHNINGVFETIVDTLKPVPLHPNPLPNGEREQA